MTWKRAATAAVLVPVVVDLVLWGSTAIVAIALITLLALQTKALNFEEQRGHGQHKSIQNGIR